MDCTSPRALRYVSPLSFASLSLTLSFPTSQIQTLKTAIEASRMLLRVDDVVQAVRKEKEEGGGGAPPEEAMGEQ
jgi:hypothetical protein